MEQTCNKCGSQFEYHRKKKYCSVDCREPAYKPRQIIPTIKICRVCNHSFATIFKKQKYCGDECQRKGKLLPKITLPICKCKGCGKQYLPKVMDRNQYCSRKCAFKYRPHSPTEGRRKNNRVYHVVKLNHCKKCNKLFNQKYGNLFCSAECRTEYRKYKRINPSLFNCAECETPIHTEYGNKRRRFCSTKCAKKRGGRIGKRVRRAMKLANGIIERIDPVTIHSINKWMCCGCGCSTPRILLGTHDGNAPELDHINPLSKGGTHTMTNVQTLCRDCNILKGDMSMDEFINMHIRPVAPQNLHAC